MTGLEERIERDPLAERLRRMSLPPTPINLASDAAAAIRAPRRWWTARRTALCAGAASIALLSSAMAWPPARQAVGDGWQRALQLYGAPANRPGGLAEATSNGYRVRVVGAYDDGSRVLISLGEEPADGRKLADHEFISSQQATVTDSRGRVLATEEGSTGEVLILSRPADGAGAGTPLTVHVTQLLDEVNVAPPQRGLTWVSGGWSLRFNVPPSPGPQDLPSPSGGSIGPGVQVRFDAVRVTDAYLNVQYTVTGVPQQAITVLARLADPEDKQSVVMSIEMPISAKGGAPEPPPPYHSQFDWQLAAKPGTYRLTLTTDDGRSLERDIKVSRGRAPSIPVITQEASPISG